MSMLPSPAPDKGTPAPAAPDQSATAALLALSEAATPGPWNWATAPHPDELVTKAEYQTRALVNGDEPLWVIHAQDGSTDVDYVIPCITGDGPTSRANAEFIVAAVAFTRAALGGESS